MAFFKAKGGGSGGGSLPPKIINVPADYPTDLEANKNMGRHYYIGGTPSVTDNDPTKTNTGQTFLLSQDIMWDGVSAYFKVGDDAIWSTNGSDVKTVTPLNVDMQGKGLKNTNLWTTIRASDADYSDINTAITASKYNLWVIGDFTQPTYVNGNANLLTLTIEDKLRLSDQAFTLGSGGIKVEGGSIIPAFSVQPIHKIFSSSVLAPLTIDNCFIDMTGALDPSSGIARMWEKSKNLIHNCNCTLANSTDSGFYWAGSGSSFTNLQIIGGGTACEKFLTLAEDCICSNWHISGVFKTAGILLDFAITPSILNNILYTGANETRVDLNIAGMQLNNIKGKLNIVCFTGGHLISNCEISTLDLLNATNDNKISNVTATSSAAIEISGNNNELQNFTTAGDLLIYGDGNWLNNVKAANITISGDNNQLSIVEGTTYTDTGINNSINLTNINSAGMLTGGAITDAGGETIAVALGTGYLRIADSHTGVLVRISWPLAAGIAIPTDTVRYVGIEYNSGTPQAIIKSTDTWNRHTEFRLGSVVNEGTTLRLLNNPWQVANAEGHAIERFFETLPFKRADRIGGLIIGETGVQQITLTAGELYDLTNEFTIPAIDTSVSGGFDSYAGLTLFASGTSQWDDQNYNNAGTITALGVAKWGTLWWYLEADGKLVMNYGIAEHNTQAGADLEGEPPVRPVRVQVHGTLIGRTIFQKSAGTGDFQSAFITQFAGSGSSDHTQLSNLTTGDAGHTQFPMLVGRAGGQILNGGTLTTQTVALRNNTVDDLGMDVNADGSLAVNTLNYAALVTAINDIPNKAYVDAHKHLIDLDNIIYRNGAGNDSNSGKNIGAPKKTLVAAIAAGVLQTPSASNIITIKDLGGAKLNEDVTLPSWMVLDTSDAEVVGQVTLGVTMAADSYFYFNKASPESGSECIRISGSGTRYIKGNSTGAALNSTFIVADGGAVVYLDIVKANAVAAGAKFYTFATGAALFIKAQTFRETVASTSTGATVFRNIVDDGANADTNTINETGNQLMRGKDKVTFGTSAADVLELNGLYQKWLTAPLFVAYNNAQISNVTGDGTVYTIILGQVDANIGTHYNTGTGIFTAPTTGIYSFNIVLVLVGMASNTDVNIRVVRTGTAATWYLHQSDPDKVIVGGYLILNGSIEMKLNAADTAKFQVQVAGVSKVVDVEVGTTFSGKLLTQI